MLCNVQLINFHVYHETPYDSPSTGARAPLEEDTVQIDPGGEHQRQKGLI